MLECCNRCFALHASWPDAFSAPTTTWEGAPNAYVSSYGTGLLDKKVVAKKASLLTIEFPRVSSTKQSFLVPVSSLGARPCTKLPRPRCDAANGTLIIDTNAARSFPTNLTLRTTH